MCDQAPSWIVPESYRSLISSAGIAGLVAAYELMTVSHAMRRLIRPQCEAEAIHDLAIAEGMVPVPQHAMILARSGAIALSEAYRLRID